MVGTSTLIRGTLYEVLGVSSSATRQEIKTQFYRLSMLYHPDSTLDENANSAAWRHEKFILISQAYAILSNDRQRRVYDLENGIGDRSQSWRPNLRPSTTEMWKRQTSRSPFDAPNFVVNDAVKRWTRWVETSDAGRKAIEINRAKREYERIHSTTTNRNRLIILTIVIVCYLMVPTPPR
jgi:DnaJ-class molecular chaperone